MLRSLPRNPAAPQLPAPRISSRRRRSTSAATNSAPDLAEITQKSPLQQQHNRPHTARVNGRRQRRQRRFGQSEGHPKAAIKPARVAVLPLLPPTDHRTATLTGVSRIHSSPPAAQSLLRSPSAPPPPTSLQQTKTRLEPPTVILATARQPAPINLAASRQFRRPAAVVAG